MSVASIMSAKSNNFDYQVVKIFIIFYFLSDSEFDCEVDQTAHQVCKRCPSQRSKPNPWAWSWQFTLREVLRAWSNTWDEDQRVRSLLFKQLCSDFHALVLSAFGLKRKWWPSSRPNCTFKRYFDSWRHVYAGWLNLGESRHELVAL